MRLGVSALLVLTLMGSAPPSLSGQDQAPASHARRGLVIGAISGGVAGSLSLGVLASGLCEFDCENAFLEGFLVGLAGGSVFGGVAGLVIGAAIPRQDADTRDENVEPWALGLGVGPRFAGPSVFEGADLYAGITALRPTTSRIRWGLELAYLGRGTESNVFSTTGRDGGRTTFMEKWRRSLWTLSLVATRSLGQGRLSGFYALANVGAYPLTESLTSIRTQTLPDPLIPTQVSERSFTALPGIGIGGGGLWRIGDRAGMGVESRLHLVLGAGDESVLTVFSAGLVLRLSGR